MLTLTTGLVGLGATTGGGGLSGERVSEMEDPLPWPRWIPPAEAAGEVIGLGAPYMLVGLALAPPDETGLATELMGDLAEDGPRRKDDAASASMVGRRLSPADAEEEEELDVVRRGGALYIVFKDAAEVEAGFGCGARGPPMGSRGPAGELEGKAGEPYLLATGLATLDVLVLDRAPNSSTGLDPVAAADEDILPFHPPRPTSSGSSISSPLSSLVATSASFFLASSSGDH